METLLCNLLFIFLSYKDQITILWCICNIMYYILYMSTLIISNKKDKIEKSGL